MSLRIRFRFDGRCSLHPRYNPQKDGRSEHKDCPGCEALYVISLYSGIARKKAVTGDGMVVSNREALMQESEMSAESEESKSSPLEDLGS